MFDHIRTFGLTNRPAGYAQVPDGWERVSDRTPEFNHGIIRYDRALTVREIEGFELTPFYSSPRECAEAMVAAIAEQDGKTIERVKALIRLDIVTCEDVKMAEWPTHRVIGGVAQRFHRKARIWPLGQYSNEAVLPAMVAYLAE